MMTLLALLLGVALTSACLMLGEHVLQRRPRALADRIAPHWGVQMARRRGWVGVLSLGGGTDRELDARLAAAGLPRDAQHYRSGTLLRAGLAGLGAVLVLCLAAVGGTVTPWAGLLLVLSMVIVCVWWRSYRLRLAATRRRTLMAAQFPLLAELLALGVAAGDGVAAALSRAADGVPSPLREELEAALVRVRAGVPLGSALNELAERTGGASLAKCVDAVAVASERGTPLAAVLRDQATDAREAARRELMESAGKKEIAMMAPVIFGVLPLSVVFAIYPGLTLLSLGP